MIGILTPSHWRNFLNVEIQQKGHFSWNGKDHDSSQWKAPFPTMHRLFWKRYFLVLWLYTLKARTESLFHLQYGWNNLLIMIMPIRWQWLNNIRISLSVQFSASEVQIMGHHLWWHWNPKDGLWFPTNPNWNSLLWRFFRNSFMYFWLEIWTNFKIKEL